MIIHRRGIRIVLVVAAIFAALAGLWIVVWTQFANPGTQLRRGYVWHADELYVLPSDGTPVVYMLATRDGESIHDAVPVASVDGTLAYWSPMDNAIAVLSTGGPAEWYVLPKSRRLHGMSVTSIGVAGRYVVCSYHVAGQEGGVYVLDVRASKWSQVPDAVEARAHGSDNESIVVLSKNRVVARVELDRIASVEPMTKLGSCTAWEYDLASDTLFWLDADGKVYAKSGTKQALPVRLPYGRNPTGLAWQPDIGELWVPVSGLFSMYGFVVASRTGDVLGFVENCIGPCASVHFASEDLLQTLSHSGSERKTLTWKNVCGK